MALIVTTCVAAGAAVDVARDGGGPPRERTRAEALPLPISLIGPVGTAAPARTTRPLASLPSPAPARSEDLGLELSAVDRGARDLTLQKRLPEWVARNPEAAANEWAQTLEPPTSN